MPKSTKLTPGRVRSRRQVRTFYVPPATYLKLRALADATGETLSGTVVAAIEAQYGRLAGRPGVADVFLS